MSIKKAILITALVAAPATLIACGSSSTSGGSGSPVASISPQQFTDALHLVMATDRAVYTKRVVNRLAKQEKVIKASEHFTDDKALPLPAQMFRFGAEGVAEKTDEFSYSLQSLWPINAQNAPKTAAEKEGLQYLEDNPGENFYTEETIGGTTFFTAVYPDPAVAPVCVTCHNEHKDSPRTDFKLGDTMGGVVIRVPLGT